MVQYSIFGRGQVNSQADKYTMDHVDSRIEAFLKDFSTALKTQCTRRFKFVKRSLRDEKECVDFDLQVRLFPSHPGWPGHRHCTAAHP